MFVSCSGLFYSSIDEIVLSYVVSILEDLGTEASVEEAFDVEGFCEMMAAYFPEFSTIHHAAVCQWMFELEATLSQKKGNGELRSTAYSFIHSFIHLVVCLTTGPKPLPKRALHIVRSRASSFK
jgi:hypothetical protein